MQKKEPEGARRSRGTQRSIAMVLLVVAFVVVAAGGWWTDRASPLPPPLQPVSGLKWWTTPVEKNAFMRLPVVQGNLYAIASRNADGVILAVGERGLIVGTHDGGRTWWRGTVVADATPAATPAVAPSEKPTAAPATSPPANSAAKPALRSDASGSVERGEYSWSFIRAAHAEVPPSNAARQPATPGGLTIDGDTAKPAANASYDPAMKPAQTQSPAQTSQSTEPSKTPPSRSPAQRAATPAQNTAPNASAASDKRVPTTRQNRPAAPSTNAPNADGAKATDNSGAAAQQPPVTPQPTPITVAPADPSPPDLHALTLFSRNVAIATGERDTVLRTEDGGITWRAAAPNTPPEVANERGFQAPQGAPPNIRAAFQDADGTIYAAGMDGAIYSSQDNGAHWSVRSAHGGPLFKDLAFYDARRGIVVGDRGTLLVTDDGGETWSVRASGVTETLHAITFADEQRAIAAGDRGTLLVSTDKGDSWSPRTLDPSLPAVLDVDFADGLRGFAVGADASVYATLDGGEHWKDSGTPVSSPDSTFAVLSARRGLALVGRYDEQPNRSGNATGFWLLSSDDNTGGWSASRGGVRQLTPVFRRSQTQVDFGTAQSTVDRLVTLTPKLAAWVSHAADPPAPVAAFAFADDDERGVAVGREGNAFFTTNGGAQWLAATSAAASGGKPADVTTADLTTARFISDNRAIALGVGRIFLSDDAGRTWKSVEYRRYPSPWLWLAGAGLLIATIALMRRRYTSPEVTHATPSVTDSAVSDSPIGWKDPDAIGLQGIARDLSRFLRNRRTQPPLTIAVTGEWGSGKSSLMNLLREELTQHDFHPVWFNAWHHQSGENLLGSLLANIHAQAVPPLFSAAGVDFRGTLLLVRLRRFWLRLVVALFVLGLLYFGYDLFGSNAADLFRALTGDPSVNIDTFAKAKGLLGVIAWLIPLIGAIRAMSAFGLQPGKLIAAVASSKQDDSARVTPGARYQFAREFKDFTDALDPRTLVIFIDDLDRCRPPNVVEVLEAINFLVTSGRCIIVLGMARRWVEACVGQAFSELAAANADAAADAPSSSRRALASAAANSAATPLAGAGAISQAMPPNDRAAEQRQFAKNYLEKLINIEICIPRLTEDASRTILESSSTAVAEPSRWSQFLSVLRRFAPALKVAAWVVMTLLAAHFCVDRLRNLNARVEQSRVDSAKPPVATPANAATTAGSPASEGPQGQSAPIAQHTIAFEPSREVAAPGWYLGIVGSVAAALLGLILLVIFARKDVRTDDSVGFRNALQILQPWILLGGSSPRSLKRFINHLRYLAMRVRVIPEEKSGWDALRARVAVGFGERPPSAATAATAATGNRAPLEEHLLVALSAVDRCNDSWLAEMSPLRPGRMEELLTRDLAQRFADAADLKRVAAKLSESLAEFNKRFSNTALFINPVADRGYIVSYYSLMARELAEPAAMTTGEVTPATPLHRA